MRFQDPRLEDSRISNFEVMAIKQVGHSRLMQEKQISRLGKYQVGSVLDLVHSIFFPGSKTRRWIFKSIPIQAVCLYSSVLFLDPFSL